MSQDYGEDGWFGHIVGELRDIARSQDDDRAALIANMLVRLKQRAEWCDRYALAIKQCRGVARETECEEMAQTHAERFDEIVEELAGTMGGL